MESEVLVSQASRLVENFERSIYEISSIQHRFQKCMNQNHDILMRIEAWYRDYCYIEKLLDDCWDYRYQKFKDVCDQRIQKPLGEYLLGAREAAESVREAMGLSASESVRDVVSLLESHGIKVAELPISSSHVFFGSSLKSDTRAPAIIVNTYEQFSIESWIFTVVCELCYLLFYDENYQEELGIDHEKQEKDITEFASFFLMPEGFFIEKWEDARGLPFVDRVLKVKRFFGVSYKTVLNRLTERYETSEIWKKFYLKFLERHKKHLISTDEYDRLCQGFIPLAGAEIKRSQEPAPLLSLDFKSTRLRRLVYKAVYDRADLSVARGAEILGISFADMRMM